MIDTFVSWTRMRCVVTWYDMVWRDFFKSFLLSIVLLLQSPICAPAKSELTIHLSYDGARMLKYTRHVLDGKVHIVHRTHLAHAVHGKLRDSC